MKSINHFMALIVCLFVGISMFLVAGICAADETNYYYYSGGDHVGNIMYRTVDLGNSTAAYLDFSTRYGVELGDFAIAFVSPNIDDLISWEYLNGTEPNWITKSYG